MLGNGNLSRRGIEGAEIDGCHFNLFQCDGCPTAKGIKFFFIPRVLNLFVTRERGSHQVRGFLGWFTFPGIFLSYVRCET